MDNDHISPSNPELTFIGKYTNPEVTLASFILISTNGKRPVTLATESSEPHKKVSPASAVGLEKSRLFIERESSTLSPLFTVPDVT